MNSIAEKRLKATTFYLDECIYSRVLLDRMQKAGANVEHVGGAFPKGTEDQVWLSACGQKGWVVLTRDRRIRKRPLELAAIRDNGVAVFCLTSRRTSASESADIIVPMLQKMVNMFVSESKPFLYTFARSRHLSKARLNT